MTAEARPQINPTIFEQMRYDAETGTIHEPVSVEPRPQAYMPFPDVPLSTTFGVRRLLDEQLAQTLRRVLVTLQEIDNRLPETMDFPVRPGVLLLPQRVLGRHKGRVPLVPLKDQLETQCRNTIQQLPYAEIVDLRFQGRNQLNLIVACPELSREMAAIRKVLGWHSIHGIPEPVKENSPESLTLLTKANKRRYGHSKRQEIFTITLGQTSKLPKLVDRKHMELEALQAIDDVHGVEQGIKLQHWEYIEPVSRDCLQQMAA